MRKCVTPIIAIVLLSLMTVGAVGVAFFWMSNVQSSVSEQAGSAVGSSPGSDCSRLNIVSVRGDSVAVSNVGCDTVENVSVVVDGVLTEYEVSLGPGEATTISFTESMTVDSEHCVSVVLPSGVRSTECVSSSQATESAGYGEGDGFLGVCDNIQPVYRNNARIFGEAGNIDYSFYLGHNYSAPAGSVVRRVDVFLPYANSSASGSGYLNVFVTDDSVYSSDPSSLTPDESVFVQNSTENKWVSVDLSIPVSGEFIVIFNLENTTYWDYSNMPFGHNKTMENSTLVCSILDPTFPCSDGIDKYEELAGFGLAFNMIVHLSTSDSYGSLCDAGQFCYDGSCSLFLTNIGECVNDDDCNTGETCCSSVCVDTSIDENNCGDCGITCTTNQYCDSGTCIECDNACDGLCPSTGCTNDPDCNGTECCGNDYCNLTAGETCENCEADCGICYYQTTSFSDGSSSKTLNFQSPGSNVSAKLRINKSASINLATLCLKGIESRSSIYGEEQNDWFGSPLSSGDVNNDGYDDLLVGSMGGNKAYLFWGSSSGLDHLSNVTLIGNSSSYDFGESISSGDVNNDGYDDVIIGSRTYGSGDEGRVYVFWGNETNDFVYSRNYTLDKGEDDNFGRSVFSGDVNNDGYDDVLVGATTGTYGDVFVFWGNETNDFTNLRNYTIDHDWYAFGDSVSSGDLNGDGYDDVLVGVPGSGGEGGAYIFWGNETNDFTRNNNYTLPYDDWSMGSGFFGESVFSGDLNGDGYDDFLVGRPEDSSNQGEVYVFWGSSSGINYLNNYSIIGEEVNDGFGQNIFSDDLNGDGYDDFFVGASYCSMEKGRAYIFWGSSQGIDYMNNKSFDGNTFDYVGSSMRILDSNNDNYPELVLGGPGSGQSLVGLVYVYDSSMGVSSPSLMPGSDMGESWSHTGKLSFFDSEVANIFSEISSILPDCSCSGCSLSNNNCTIDLNVTSESAGSIRLLDLFVNYSLS